MEDNSKEVMELKLLALENEVKYQKEMILQKEVEVRLAKAEITNLDKPKITSEIFNAITYTIERAIMDYSFCGVDDFDYDFEIDYDNRLTLSSIDLNDTDKLEQHIETYIEQAFNIVQKEQ